MQSEKTVLKNLKVKENINYRKQVYLTQVTFTQEKYVSVGLYNPSTFL